jgi:hypothetical protein
VTSGGKSPPSPRYRSIDEARIAAPATVNASHDTLPTEIASLRSQ